MTGFKSTRRPLSILLSVLIILLSLAAATIPLTINANAAAPARVYFQPHGEWEKDGATFKVFFSSTRSGTGYTLHAAYLTGDNIRLYWADVPSNLSPSKISFARYDSNGTTYWNGQVTNQTYNKNYLYTLSGNHDSPSCASTPFSTSTKPTFIVVGDSTLFGSTWSPSSSSGNTLTYDSTLGYWKKVYNNVSSTFKYKVTQYKSDNSWTNTFPTAGGDNDHNLTCDITKKSNVTIYFDPFKEDADAAQTVWAKADALPDTYTVRLTDDQGVVYGNDKTPMTQASSTSDYTATFKNIKKGTAKCTIYKNGSTSGTTHEITTINQWDATVTIKLNSSGTWQTPDIVYPTYRIYGTSDIFGSESPNNDLTANKLEYNLSNNEYAPTNSFSVKNNGEYWYNVSKNGASKWDYNKDIQIAHDNSKISITYKVANNTDLGTGDEKITKPTYTYNGKNFTLASAETGASPIDHQRYQSEQFTWDGHTTAYQITGAIDQPINITDSLQSGCKITLYYDEVNHKLAYEIEQPPENKNHYGDINNDKKYNVIDAYIIRKIVDAGDDADALKAIGLADGENALEYKLADVNNDNKVNSDDLELMNDYIVGNIQAGTLGGNHIEEEYDESAP